MMAILKAYKIEVSRQVTSTTRGNFHSYKKHAIQETYIVLAYSVTHAAGKISEGAEVSIISIEAIPCTHVYGKE